MLGAIIGDIVGSRFEWHNHRSKEFEFYTEKCSFTDDSVMTLAVAWAILQADGDWETLGALAVKGMQGVGRRYPDAKYGAMFMDWLFCEHPQPYNSWGNGAAMRVSPCGFAAGSMEEAIELSRRVTEVTHNHPEGIKGAEATTVAIWLARQGKDIHEIRAHMTERYYRIGFTLDEIRASYQFNESCPGTVPQALEAFFESTGFEDAIRNAISIGGDSDTLAAITGGIAEAYYGIPKALYEGALYYLDDDLREIICEFEGKYPG